MSKPAAIEDIYPLSPLQSGLLFHTLLEPNSGIYFEQLTCELHGMLDESAFARTWQLLVERHPILRTAFVWKGQREPVQVVHRKLELPWRKEDWRGIDPKEQRDKLAMFLEDDRRRGFELNRAPLMRIATIWLADNLWQLVSSHHHILLDGWSFPLLLREFGEAYRAFCAGSNPKLVPAGRYSSYVAWLKGRDSAKAETFWRDQMRGFSAPTTLAIDRPRNLPQDVASTGYEEVAHVFSAADTELLQTAARDFRVTLNTLMQGAYALVLGRYSGSDDIVFGATVAGRPPDLPGVENMVGLFINTLPFRVAVWPDAETGPWLAGIQERQLAIQDFEFTALSDIQKWSDISRGQPLFESLLVFENYPIDASLPHKLGGLEPRAVTFVERTNYPLTIIAVPGDRLGLRASFDTARIERAAAGRLLGHIAQALRGLARPGVKLGHIDIVTDSEKAEILAASHAPASSANTETLPEWFAQQVIASPEAIALSDAGKQVTYRELDARANQVAHRLANQGVRPAERVGLLMERNAGLVVGVLGILKAGAAYVPMDPIYPDDRLAWMISDSGTRVLVTERSLASRVSCETLIVDDASDAPSTPAGVVVSAAHPAYVIYTSGSTGRPKGCLITHGNVTRLFRTTESWFGFGPSDVWTLFHSAAFDFSVWEIWGSLLYGGRLVVIPYYTSREPEAFVELVIREGVTVLNQTPSAFRQFMAVEERQPVSPSLRLRYVIFGGEALDLASLRPWFIRHGDTQPQLVNMYGITETTVHVTYRPLRARDASENRGSLIGEALPDLRLVTLDASGNLSPVGIAGELFVAGLGLSPGYLDRPELTAQRFVADPFGLGGSGGRLYRTGDLARRLPDGDFEYLGRVDQQVKIRGFRIELGEIESELSALSGIQESVVLMRDDRLVAYVVAREGERPTVDELRAGLRLRLPEYMVPPAFVWLDKLPLTSNGKLDRAALPSPSAHGLDRLDEYVAPRTEQELLLADIWREVLQVERVGIRDNYFALGGDSIRSLAIRSRARDKGIEFSLQALFERQTIEALLSTEPSDAPSAAETGLTAPFSQIAQLDRASIPPDVVDAYPLTRLQLGMVFHSHEHSGSSRYLDSFSFHLRGPLKREVLQAALDGLVERHGILRTSFDLTVLPEPLQLVHGGANCPIEWIDLETLPHASQENAIDVFVNEEARRPFDWTQAPLFRVSVHPRGKTFQFTLTAHHAILDGWSVATLLTELFHDYLFRLGLGGKPARSQVGPVFSDFVALERNALSNAESRDFWHSMMADAPFLTLPKPLHSFTGKRYGSMPVDVPVEVSAGLISLAERLGVPLKSVLLTAHIRVLSLIGGQEDVVTGLVSNGRPEASGADRLAGLFLNVLPLRVRFPHGTWADAVKAVFSVEKAMMPHRRVPLAETQRAHGPSPLFDTDFNFVNFHIFDSLRGLDVVQLVDTRSSEETNFAVAANFSVESGKGDVHGSLSVDRELLDSDIAESLPGLYGAALTAIALSPDQSWRSAVLAPETAFHRSAGPSVAFPEELLLQELVESQVDRTPDAVAVVDENGKLTYAELDARANRVAHWLITRGVRSDGRVGIAINRSTDLVVAMLATLKAGAAWVPMDSSYPAERTALLKRDSGAQMILTELPDGELAGQPDTRPAISAWPESAAYVIYTSGSTGTPKGVVVTHAAIVNHMQWMQREFPLDAGDVVLQKTPANFDASVWEFWAPLISGARLAMAQPGGHQDPAYLAEAVRQYGVTTLQLVPSVLDFFLEHADRETCSSLRRVYAGGEALRSETRNRFYQRFDIPLINLYGPTEAAVDSVVEVCPRDGEIAIGKPIANLQSWVLDQNLSPVPAGVAGELFLGGAGLARGYLGRPALTAERFIPDHLSRWPGMRLYRTGDLVRQEANGTLFYLGRADDQVKVRGHRVEPGEVEAVLGSAAGVERAVVIAHQGSLIAYAVARPGARLDSAELLGYLRERLPAALVPADVLFLDRLPLSPNGKLDRRGLPLPNAKTAVRRRPLVPPSTALELQLAGMWKDVLGVAEVGIHDNFFELGGDSIQSLRLVSIATRGGLRLRPKQVFDHPTIEGLARVVVDSSATVATQGPEIDFDNIPLLPVQRDFFALGASNPHHWNQAVLVQTPGSLTADQAEGAWRATVDRHPAFRLRFGNERAGWRQFLANEAGCPFATANLTDLDRVAAEAHTSLDIHKGPVAKSIFFPVEGRWLIVAHHLVVDGVSWRILLEELATGISVPEERSFPGFAASLRNEANSAIAASESAYWRGVAEQAGSPLPLDFPDGGAQNRESSVDSVQWALDEAATASLLRELPVAFRCRVEELLLAAMAANFGGWFDLEGHGREDDLAHTVGWFTSVYPVRLPDSGNAWARLRGVKETLRSIPRKGIGFGMLRDFSDDAVTRAALAGATRPEVSFNYLGQIDVALSSSGVFRPAAEPTGRERSPDSPRTYLIDVVAMISGGRLRMEWLYSRSAHRRETIEAAVHRFAEELQFLLANRNQAQTVAASDFPLAGLSDSAVSQIVASSPPLQDIWPLTPLQEGMLVHSVHGNDSGVYGQQVAVELRGPLDLAVLQRAWSELARRHDVLRVEFRWEDLPSPRQVVRTEVPVDIAVLDWTAPSSVPADERFREWLALDRTAGFDLARGPLWRVTVIRLAEDRWRLIWSHHHLLLDGWSLPIVFQQLLGEYSSVQRHQAVFRYRDYLSWLKQRDVAAEAEFWKDALAAYHPTSTLELGPPPNAERTQSSQRTSLSWELTPTATGLLKELAQGLQITLGTCIQAAWGLALARWTKQSETVFGLVVAGRPAELPGVENAVGMFINTLPLRVRAPRRQAVAEWLREIHRQVAALRQFEHSRLVDVQSWSEVPRGQQLFEAVLIIENYPLNAALGTPVGGVEFGKVDTFEQTSLPLNLYAVPGERLEMRLEYAQARFQDHVMQSFARSLRNLLEALPEHASDPVATLPMTGGVAQPSGSMEAAWNRTAVHDRISAISTRQSSSVAVLGASQTLSYGDLDERSNRLANYLRGAGAGPGKLIGVYLDRSPELLVALLGILKTGAAYVPMDPAFPVERLAMMVADSQLGFVITRDDLAAGHGLLPESIVQVRLDADSVAIAGQSATAPGYVSDPDELAYVIFTSGSTGRPKGVQVTHGALSNFLSHFAQSPGLTAGDVLVAVTTLSFDIAGLELFLPLVCGARVVIATRETAADGRALASLLASSGATVMQATPATWRLLLAEDWRPVRAFRAWCGGEALPADLARDLHARGVALWNFYGPTETTIWSTTQEVVEQHDALSIGRPIANTLAWVLDDDLNPVPVGMVGELYLGGEGVARGYIARPGLTAERFIPDPFGSGGRLYATGDQARWEPNDRLTFLGRGDQQVKIRGFRIELEEIEQVLRAVPHVRGAAVAARKDHQGNPRLVAWVQGLSAAGGVAAVRGYLRDQLPDYMLPAAFMEIDALPLTPNGKLDRRALQETVMSEGPAAGFVAPGNAIEQVLADIWREVLGIERVGANGQFFELGGHSLLAAQALARIRKYFQVDLSLRTFFQTATPESVALALVAIEPAAGRILKIATALLKLRAMTPEEKARLRERSAEKAALGKP